MGVALARRVVQADDAVEQGPLRLPLASVVVGLGRHLAVLVAGYSRPPVEGGRTLALGISIKKVFRVVDKEVTSEPACRRDSVQIGV